MKVKVSLKRLQFAYLEPILSQDIANEKPLVVHKEDTAILAPPHDLGPGDGFFSNHGQKKSKKRYWPP